jgi:hypothetical protein
MGKVFRVSLGFLLIAIGGLLKVLALFGESQEGATVFGKEPVEYDEKGNAVGAFTGAPILDPWQ